MNLHGAESKYTGSLPFQQRLDRLGGAALERTPGAGEGVRTIFQGVSILAGQDYPLWRLEHLLKPLLETYELQDVLCWEDLVFHAMDLAENVSRKEGSVSAEQRRDGYELLYELLVAPFCYLTEMRNAKEGRLPPDDQEDWAEWDESIVD